MSKAITDTKSNEESYTTKLDIGIATPRHFKRLIDLYAENPRVVLCGVGVPGGGKSQSVKQAAAARGVPFPSESSVEDFDCPSQVLHIPQMQVEDFYIPTVPADKKDKRFYDKRIPRRFEAVIAYVEKNEAEIVAGTKGRPILLIEEPNRARDKAVTAALFTLIEDRMIGDTRISPLVQIVCLMNPSGGSMAVNQFEKDSAARRRLLFIGITPSFGEFLEHATAKKFHPKVTEFLRAQPLLVYDNAASLAGHVYACPASWETVSDILLTTEKADLPLTGMESQVACAGKIGMTVTTALFDFIDNNATLISADDVISNYRSGSSVRSKVLEARDKGRDDILTNLCASVATIIFHDRKPPKSYAAQLGLFMDDLMPTLLVTLVSVHFANEAKKSGGMQYWKNQMGTAFANEPAFQSAMKTVTEAKAKAQKEKEEGTDPGDEAAA